MVITNIHEAKTQLSKLVERALQGEEVIIGKAGKPVAKLVRYELSQQPRRPGYWRGKVKLAKDFDELPVAVLAGFAGDNGHDPTHSS